MIIKQILPLRDFSFTGSDGKPVTSCAQGFVLTDGCNTLYAETSGNYAKAVLALKLAAGQVVTAQLEFSMRDYQTKDGETRYETKVRITNISLFAC